MQHLIGLGFILHKILSDARDMQAHALHSERGREIGNLDTRLYLIGFRILIDGIILVRSISKVPDDFKEKSLDIVRCGIYLTFLLVIIQ